MVHHVKADRGYFSERNFMITYQRPDVLALLPFRDSSFFLIRVDHQFHLQLGIFIIFIMIQLTKYDSHCSLLTLVWHGNLGKQSFLIAFV